MCMFGVIASTIVADILLELETRHDLRQVLDSIDDETMIELLDSLETIVKTHLEILVND